MKNKNKPLPKLHFLFTQILEARTRPESVQAMTQAVDNAVYIIGCLSNFGSASFNLNTTFPFSKGFVELQNQFVDEINFCKVNVLAQTIKPTIEKITKAKMISEKKFTKSSKGIVGLLKDHEKYFRSTQKMDKPELN